MGQGQAVRVVYIVCVVPLFAPVCDDRDLIEDAFMADAADLGLNVDEVFSTYGDTPDEEFDAIVLACSFEHGRGALAKLAEVSEKFLIGHIEVK